MSYLFCRKRLRETGKLVMGNSIYQIKFDAMTFPAFGARYHFFLEDAVDSPEYLVELRTLARLANDFDLEIVSHRTLHEVFLDHQQPHHLELLQNIGALNQQGTISAEEWEASGIYLAVVMRKKGEFRYEPQQRFGVAGRIPEDTMIDLTAEREVQTR
eukprot:TRINITY_DN4563_c0_g1_i2.p2 TRINITY_DN4563_c0_g1~~TRINITY_DN4563_c0_g1_i2.p2  ORF type:complete len:158 (+),score=26.82 TRINITY_DN4563_c0_g1_i2:635-1108(+)